MLRTLALLALVCLCTGTYWPYRTASPISNIYDADLPTTEPMPFRAHTEHRFLYNVQIASGLVAPSDEDAASMPQQKAVMRGQCLVRLQFASERYAQLRLEQCRVGEQNEPMSEPQKVQPMDAFEPKMIPEDMQKQLELPCQFSYEDGVIEHVQFHEADDMWSKNMKRAVLNMIQMKKEQSIEKANQRKTYTVPETTLEGACQTTYTIYKLRGEQQQFNVTKSINFKQCQQVADVAYGYQTQQPQARCALCQQQFWTQQQQLQQQNDEQHPCAKCDPKEVKEQELDRSTVIRCQIQQDQDQPNALKRCELVSQYVYRNSKIEDGKYGSAMQMVVSASLEARGGAQLQAEAEQQIPAFESGKQESLMYSNQWEMDVKRFYMFGDDEFGQNGKDSPFARVPKMQQAGQALRKLAQAMEDTQRGIEQQAPAQLQRLVEMLRMSTETELKSIEQKAQNAQEKQICMNAMAVCGTRNCVARLAEKIRNKEIKSAQAVQTLLALNQIPAPSDPIVQEIEQLCASQTVKEQPALKQSCWLTFGALVNELCQYSMEQNMNNNGQQRGFLMEEQQCPMVKKQQYKEAMLTVYKNSDCIYDKMVALNALGNAGLDISVMDLEQIIRDASEARVVRVKAIDALRRMRIRMPRRIQRILTPIFQNIREHPQVRTAAFAIIMYTQPESQLVDQLMYTIGKVPNKQVRAFAYRTMKMMANSQNPNERKIAQHIKAALKVANVDEDELRAMSGKWQVPLLYNAEQREGLFATVATTISTRSALPVYAHAQLDSQFNEQFQHNAIKLYMMQQEAEQWYGKMTDNFKQFTSISRAERQTKGRHNAKLRNIFKVLGIKNRLSNNYYQEEDGNMMEQSQNMNQPFAMLCLRTNDVDRGFWALDQHTMSEQTKKMLNGEMSMLGFVELVQNQLQPIIDGAMVGNLNEKQARIPTSAGVPLKLLNSMPVMTNIQQGQARISIKMDSTITMGMKGQITASVAHIQKMECWTPFLASGVQSIRSAELNLPLDAEINADLRQAAINIKVNLPRQETQLAAIQSLPITYTATVDPRTELVNGPSQMRTIHNLKLERQQHEMDTMWTAMGMPIRVQGFFHCPSTPSFEQLVQMLMATENLVHITYQPDSNSPRELFFRTKSAYFQKAKISEFEHPQQLSDFYNTRLDSAYSCDASEGSECHAFAMHEQYDAQELEQKQERQQQLNTFMEQYKKDGQQYKHSLKLSMQTDKNARAQCEMQMQCDASVQFCKVQMKADRTPMFPEESRKWTLKADAQLLMPETDAAPMTQMDQKTHKQFIARVQAHWGEQQNQQKVNLRVHGMQAYTAQVRHILQQQQQEGRDLVSARQMEQLQRRTAFLNKFHVEAQYSLKAKAQNAVRRMIEVLKSAYYWNTDSQLTEFGIQREGKAMATMVIDPLTRKHANMTIKTPEQRIRIHQIELPFRIRPFSLIHMQGAQQTHSLTQLFNHFNLDKRAECTVDGETVKTFDYYEYASPLMTSCYSVLAKDCGSDQQPQFAVMMKKATQNAQPWKKTAKNVQNEQKAIKVLTPEQEIECQPKPNSQSLICWIDGQQVNPDEQQQDQAQTVQYNNDQMDDVTIKVEGIAVRFNGRKAWMKVSPMYKSAVCGLCGYYDDSTDREDEWHMADGKIATDLAQFHRSYALSDTKVCTQQELDRFYKNDENKENQGEFHRQLSAYNDKYRKFGRVQDAEQFYGQSDAAKFGTYKSIFGLESKQTWQCCCCCADDDTECKQDCMRNEICQEMCRNKWCQKQQDDQEEGKEDKVSPVLMTKVSEQHHAVCFSAKPVKQCPRGTMWYAYGDDDEAQQQQQQKTVRFVCMERADPEARRLLRSLRQGQRVVDVPEERGTSFTDRVREPQQCRPYRGRF